MLYKRYSNPLLLLQQVLKTGELSEFITKLYEMVEEESLWEHWLHRYIEKPFNEFLEDYRRQKTPVENVETTVKHSYDLLRNFEPT